LIYGTLTILNLPGKPSIICGGENHGFIPDTGTFKDIRDLLKSVFIPALPKDSRARQIAEGANDPVNADSFLRGKAEFDGAAAALLPFPDFIRGWHDPFP